MDETLSFTKSIAFFVTSSLGKLPFVYAMMLLWSGIVVGLTGQAFMFLSYMVVMLVSYGMIRPILATMTDISTSGFLYSLIPTVQKSQSLIDEYIAVYMGIPSKFVKDLTGSSWAQKYVLLGLPDAMIFPSSFLYGYGITTAENGITDAKNMPMLFTTLISILLQLNITQMGGITAFLNVVIGTFIGVICGSFVSGNPDLGPFSKQNQSFNVVVTNVS
jgi:hypothetical protein